MERIMKEKPKAKAETEPTGIKVKITTSKVDKGPKRVVNVTLPGTVEGWQEWGWDIPATLAHSSSPRVQFQTVARANWDSFEKDPDGYTLEWFKSGGTGKPARVVERNVVRITPDMGITPEAIEAMIAGGNEIQYVGFEVA
jgi:hypothetical protein